jgi:ATP-binding cassette subfamily C protein CydD
VLAALATLALGILVAMAIARVVEDGSRLEDVWPLVALAVIIAGLRVSLTVGQEALVQRSSTRLRDALRVVLGATLRRLGPAWTAGERSGELTAVIGGGLDDLDAWLTSYQPARALAVLVPVLVLALVLVLDPPTALVLVLTGPVLVLLLAVIGSRARAVTDRRHAELRWMSGFFLEILRGIATLKAFGRSREQAENIEAVSRRYGESTMEVLRAAFQTALVLEWAGAVATAVVAVEVSLRLMADGLAFSTALAVLIVTPEFFLPLRQLAIRYHGGAAGRTAAQHLLGILDAEQDVQGARVAAEKLAPAGQVAAVTQPGWPAGRSLRLAGIHFAYPGGRSVLQGLDLRLEPGTMVALMGASGAGKSTLLWLLLRFARPDAGAILVDGVDLQLADTSVWRSNVGWVPQRPALGSGSIAEAIAMGRPDADRAAVVAAAEAAHADTFISRLASGYETPIGEGGVRLSGGQRQRLALARAFLREAPVLLLDEPTSHLDEASEEAVAASLRHLTKGRIILVVSHRRRLVESADEVAVLDRGRVVRSGPPQRLEDELSPYRRLVALSGSLDG